MKHQNDANAIENPIASHHVAGAIDEQQKVPVSNE